jgi:hypothetical protein
MKYAIEYLLKNMIGFNEMPFVYYVNAKTEREALEVFLKDFKENISNEIPIINFIHKGE